MSRRPEMHFECMFWIKHAAAKVPLLNNLYDYIVDRVPFVLWFKSFCQIHVRLCFQNDLNITWARVHYISLIQLTIHGSITWFNIRDFSSLRTTLGHSRMHPQHHTRCQTKKQSEVTDTRKQERNRPEKININNSKEKTEKAKEDLTWLQCKCSRLCALLIPICFDYKTPCRLNLGVTTETPQMLQMFCQILFKIDNNGMKNCHSS